MAVISNVHFGYWTNQLFLFHFILKFWSLIPELINNPHAYEHEHCSFIHSDPWITIMDMFNVYMSESETEQEWLVGQMAFLMEVTTLCSLQARG